jgi:TP901 family phage tail tape measure protein
MFDSLALGYSLYKPIRESIELETAMASVSKVVDFSEGGLKKFNSQILTLTDSIPLAATELAQIAAAGGQMGITEDKIIEFTELTAKMATAFDLSAQETGDAIAKLMNVYSLDIDKTRELGDTINFLTNQMATNPAAVTEIMGRIGGSAKIFGLTTDQAVALSGAFSALGKSPQVAATSINVLLNKLSTAPQQGKEFQDALEAIGLEAEELKDAIMDDAQGALSGFLSSLQGVDRRDLMGILTNLFGSGFADDIALLVGGMEQYDNALKLVTDTEGKAGAMEKEFQVQAATTANQMKLLGNAWHKVLISVGDAMKPLVQFGTFLGTQLSHGINLVINKLGPLGKIIGTVVGAVVALGVVIPVLGYAFTFAHAGLIHFNSALIALRVSTIGTTVATISHTAATKLSVLWQKIAAGAIFRTQIASVMLSTALYRQIFATNAATAATNKSIIIASLWRVASFGAAAATWALNIALLANPIVLIGAAIAGAALLIYKYWGPISEYFSGMWERIKIVFAPVINFFGSVWESVKSVFSSVGSFFSSVVSTIAAPFIWFFGWIGSIFSGIWDGLKSAFSPVGDFFGTIVGAIAAPFQALFDWLAEKFGWIGKIVGVIGDALSFVFGGEDNKTFASGEQKPASTAIAESSTLDYDSDDSDESEAFASNDYGSHGSYAAAPRQTSVSFGDIYIQSSSEAPAVIAQRIRSAVAYELEDTPQ